MLLKNYYKVLGIPKTATTREIKKAYYKLAKMFHPDLNPGRKECLVQFIELTEAYKVLGDVDNRIKYTAMVNKSIPVKPKYRTEKL
ncbi:MAG: DnAJ-like protein [Ignavibacteria bacterium]|nr:DnAJ-like protein [Ignavibacteria bacterium]